MQHTFGKYCNFKKKNSFNGGTEIFTTKAAFCLISSYNMQHGFGT